MYRFFALFEKFVRLQAGFYLFLHGFTVFTGLAKLPDLRDAFAATCFERSRQGSTKDFLHQQSSFPLSVNPF